MNTHPGSIPKAALAYIPFKAEAVSKWSNDVDILAFIRALLDQECVSVDEFGNEKKVIIVKWLNISFARINEP